MSVPELPALSFSPSELPALEQVGMLAEIGRALTSVAPQEERLERALRTLDRQLGAVRSVLQLGGKTEAHPSSVVASHGLPKGQWLPRPKQGVSSSVLESGIPMVVPQVSRDPLAVCELVDPKHWAGAVPPWSLVCVPVAMEGRVLGTLSTYHRSAREIDYSGLLDVLEVVATLIAPCLYQLEPGPLETSSSRTTTASLLDVSSGFASMVGQCAPMRLVYEQIAQVARTNATVLIRGQSGTGKELVAQAIHDGSHRAGRPFIKVNCAALPETLFESELFGHERGAFTGALTRKKGRFELAEGGTLFLDEVGELSPATQAKLLRVLQSGEFERLGGTAVQETDVRIIAATHRDLEASVTNGSFREDFYYRLNVFSISLPSLAERRTDIPALAEHFVALYARKHYGKATSIAPEALEVLLSHPFPGNVRELENAIERAVVVSGGQFVREEHLPASLLNPTKARPRELMTLAEAVGQLESQMLEQALEQAHGNASRAARTLGTTERIVRYKATKYGIDVSRFRA